VKIEVQPIRQLSADARRRLMRRSEADIAALDTYVRPLIERVRSEGDKAVRALTKEFDKVDLRDLPLRATPQEFEAARKSLPANVLQAIEVAVKNIRRGHEDQLGPKRIETKIAPGVTIGERTLPLASVGLYVPRGKGSFPSVVMMLAIPAVVAGVKRPVIVTPPGPNGIIDDATLVAAELSGVREVYRVGGVQAIAALAYGTESIPAVPKILGPGNSYVSAAKRALYGIIDPGIPAGPSESAIYADAAADADLVAHDLLIEAEHGPDSTAILVTESDKVAREVASMLPELIAALPELRRDFIIANFSQRSGIFLAQDKDEALAFVNEFAPEHLSLHADDAEALLDRIENAGEVMIGKFAPITLGNFCAGTNAILPTGGLAASHSCLGVPDFQKRSSFVHVTEEGFRTLAPTAATLADYEGFPAHALAVRRRLNRT
jgi:histidinol dehydrogenase